MKLVELLNLANNGYPDGFLSQYYDEETGAMKEGSGDGLAKFIVTEISETFDEDADETDQICNAACKMVTAIEQLRNVTNALWQG